jgi:hypothetical protein
MAMEFFKIRLYQQRTWIGILIVFLFVPYDAECSHGVSNLNGLHLRIASLDVSLQLVLIFEIVF